MNEQRESRPVRFETVHGTVEGILEVSAILRTLDDLNVVAKHFVTVHRPQLAGSDWRFDEGALAINKQSILLVQELAEPASKSKKSFGGTFSRASVRLRVGHFDVEGFVHVPAGGDPMKRLNQQEHPFLALTSASVVGDETRTGVPFLAVNRSHILAAQELPTAAPVLAAVSGENETAE